VINTLHIYEELSQGLEPKADQKLASVLGSFYEDLQHTVAKAEFTELRQVVLELARAQQRTEQRVEELAQGQQRTEARLEQLTRRVDELAEARRRTETGLAELALRVDHLAEQLNDTNKQPGGPAAMVGATLENEADRARPFLLARDHGPNAGAPSQSL